MSSREDAHSAFPILMISFSISEGMEDAGETSLTRRRGGRPFNRNPWRYALRESAFGPQILHCAGYHPSMMGGPSDSRA